jgi:pSer/pThr/pTyr-binding forkhead associated (FHA) protein
MDVKFVMFKENGERKDFPLQSGRTVIGRKADCDLRIPLADISRRHAEVAIDPRGVALKDLGSSNGTYVNNKRVTEMVLKAGDHVVIGPVVFTIQIDGEPQTIRPVKTKLERRRPGTLQVEERALAAAGGGSDAEGSGMLESEDDEDPITELEALASGDSGLSGTVLDLDEDQLQS